MAPSISIVPELYGRGYECNGHNVLERTSSVPKSVLRQLLDKVKYLDLETCSIPVLFSQIKLVGCVLDADCSLLTNLRQQHMLNEKQVIQ